MIVKNEEKSENHCIVISKQGEMIADYAKIHPFSYGAEAKFYSAGEHITHYTIDDIVFLL